MDMGLYELERQDRKQYKGFVLVVRDYRNVVVNKITREVSIFPVSVPQDVGIMWNRRAVEVRNSFETVKQAKGIVDSCYRACSVPCTER